MNDPALRPNAPQVMPVNYDVRKEARRRLMLGLSGLVVVMLVVVLAGLLAGQARHEAELAKAQAEAAGVVNAGTSAATDGAASIGNLPVTVAPPDGDVGDPPTVAPPQVIAPRAATPSAPAGVVPDLQPDPQLDRLNNNR